MKRYPLYIALVTTLSISSCSKELNQEPSIYRTAEIAITTLDDLEKAVNGAYSPLSSYRYSYSSEVALYADARGGDITATSLGYNQTLALHRLSTDRTSDFSQGTYQTFTAVLGRVNDVLSKAPAVKGTLPNNPVYQAYYEDLLGQLYALRALAHFELARIFCYLPIAGVNQDAPNSGIPLNVEVYPEGYAFKRSTLKETYAQIISDFKKALETLSKDEQTNSGKINYWAAEALLSRVYLYQADWQNAYRLAIDVISNSPYKLYPRSEYVGAWRQQGSSESLFEILTTEKSNTGLNSIGNYTRPTGYPEFAGSSSFISWFKSGHDGDIRTNLITEQADPQGGNKGYYSLKYRGRTGSSNPTAINNFKVIRLSEVYLIASEAQLKGATATGSHTALELYNTLRKHRISPYTAATSVTLDNLLDERRLELFCEGHRLFDLIRNQRNVPTEYLPGVTEVDYLNERLVSELPEREYNINPSLEVKAAK